MNLAIQIAAVKREIQLRRRIYPKCIEIGRMTEKKAAFEIEAMTAVLLTLEWLNAPPEPLAEDAHK